jgi:hypothetical protein
VSKRHQASRRRHYGRRLHEVHERHDRRAERDRPELDWNLASDDIQMDPLAFLDPRGPRTRFGFAD